MDIFVRFDEGCDALPLMLWDSVWDNTFGRADWALAGPSETRNRGGLQATSSLDTAVILALFSDKRCPPNHPLAKYAGSDLRGWWGDGVDVRADLGETDLGSLLWLLERSVATPEMARWAQSLAQDALATLVSQGVCARIDVVSGLLPAGNGVWLNVALYARDGAKIYDRRFEAVWTQVAASIAPSPVAAPPTIADVLSAGGSIDLGLASQDGAVADLGFVSEGSAYIMDLGLASS